MVAAILLLLLGGGLGGEAQDLFRAQAGTWSTRGGGPARSGATLTRPVREAPEVAWREDAGAAIEGEPLVWGDLVVLAVQKSSEQHALQARDLATGKRVAPDFPVKSPLTLEPSLWGDVVVCRTDPTEIKAVRLGSGRMVQVWTHRFDSTPGPPLLVEDAIYVATSNSLHKFTLRGRKQQALWTVPGSFRGDVVLGPRGLHVVRIDSYGQLELAHIDPETGRSARNDRLWGRWNGSGQDVELALLPAGAFARFRSPLLGIRGVVDAHITGVDPRASTPLPIALRMTSVPACAVAGWIAKADVGEKASEPVLAYHEDAGKGDPGVLATSANFPRLVADQQPVSVAGSVAYVDALAVDLPSRRILWRLEGVRPTARPVPARETVLYVDGERSLVAARARTARRAEPTLAAAEKQAGRLVLRDGSIETGEFEVDTAGRRVLRAAKTRAEEWALADVLLLEDSAERVLLAGDPLRAIDLLARAEQAGRYLDLARRARQTGAPDQLERFVDLAADHGAADKELQPLRAVLEAGKLKARASAADIAALESEAGLVARLPAESIWRRVPTLAAANAALDTLFLRGVLARDPGHAGALEKVRELLPERLRPSGSMPVLDALALIDAARRTRIEIIAPPAPGAAKVSFEEREIASRQPFWRQDLFGIRSDNLLIVTPVRELGTLARCLVLGELVCATLGGFFPEGTVARDARNPMVIELTATQEEYLQRASGGHEDSGLSWTAGHYDMQKNVTRFFLPRGDAELQSVLQTAAHELTHHWLRMRCPAWPFRSVSGTDDVLQPGYWIVEGFASFVEEFAFDLERGTWSPGGNASLRLDAVANMPDGFQLPWKDVFAVSHAQFASISKEGLVQVPSSIYLGQGLQVTTRHSFYAQAAATVRYLYEARDGALRAKLFEYLKAYYTGDGAELDLSAQLGIEADELGTAIRQHARAIVIGSE